MAGRLTSRRRWAVLAGLALAVLALHALLLQSLADELALEPEPPAIKRMEAVFTRSLAPAEPPPAPAAPPPRRRRRVAAAAPAPGNAASAPAEAPVPEAQQAVASAPEMAASEAALAPASADAAPAPEAAASALAQATPAAGAASAPAFDWPPSTRLDYRVHGEYRGPLDGWASVQWIRQGERYQVQLDVEVGLVLARRMTSDGVLTPEGLKPERYEERTSFLGNQRRTGVAFGGQTLVLNDGTSLPQPAGVQDTASQFVQMTYLFTLQPQLLAAGQHVDLPVALPRRLDTWRYEVRGEETVQTPFGPVTAWHVQPRRPDAPERAGGVLTAEAWFAPSLQYLPVRLRITDPRGAYADMLIERPPQQAEPVR